MGWVTRIAHAWNAFTNPDESSQFGTTAAYGNRPDRMRMAFSNERSIITSIYLRIALDVADLMFKHVRLDDRGRFESEINSGINNCLNLEANIDQASDHFIRDLVLSMFDWGTIAMVPVDTTINPKESGSFDIKTMRTGKIVQWYERDVRVSVYNEQKGIRQEITLSKEFVGIVENPLYTVMNEPNSTLQRLIRKLNLLDTIDEQSGSGKLDLIIQLPYVVKSESMRARAEQRRADIEFQLKGSKYGIAYTDGTEKVTQLNRPSENNLLSQVEYLTNMLYGQLGITADVMNGTADEAVMRNYYRRTIKPIAKALVQAMQRSFLTKTARSQKQSIMFFRDSFADVPMDKMGDLINAISRNEIATANEIRPVFCLPPSQDKKADELLNSNMPQPNGPQDPSLIPQPPGSSSPSASSQ